MAHTAKTVDQRTGWNVTRATVKRDKRRRGGKTECNEFVSDNNFQTPSPNSHEYSNSFLSLKQVRFVVGALQSKPGILFSHQYFLLIINTLLYSYYYIRFILRIERKCL